jgi:hypothetical protein
MDRALLVKGNLIANDMHIDSSEALIPKIKKTVDFILKLFAQGMPLAKTSPKCLVINNSIDKMNVFVHVRL